MLYVAGLSATTVNGSSMASPRAGLTPISTLTYRGADGTATAEDTLDAGTAQKREQCVYTLCILAACQRTIEPIPL